MIILKLDNLTIKIPIMRILQLMDYPIEEIEKYITEGNQHPEHILYGYILIFQRQLFD